MHLLITGATGFVGRFTLKAALDAGITTTVVARRAPDRPDPRVNWLVMDLLDPTTIEADRQQLADVTHVVHLMARTAKRRGEVIDPLELLDANMTALVGLIERLSSNLRYFCYVSTLDVYGSTQYVPMDEDHPLNPMTDYAVSKLTAERVTATMLTARTVPFSIIRLSHVYGPGEEAYEKMIPVSIQKALKQAPIEVFGGGTAQRDFIFVKDVAKGLLQACQAEAMGIYNLASGIPVPILEIAHIIARLLPGTELVVHPGDQTPMHIYFDISRAQAAFDFQPGTDLQSGLAQEVAGLQHRTEGEADE